MNKYSLVKEKQAEEVTELRAQLATQARYNLEADSDLTVVGMDVTTKRTDFGDRLQRSWASLTSLALPANPVAAFLGKVPVRA